MSKCNLINFDQFYNQVIKVYFCVFRDFCKHFWLFHKPVFKKREFSKLYFNFQSCSVCYDVFQFIFCIKPGCKHYVGTSVNSLSVLHDVFKFIFCIKSGCKYYGTSVNSLSVLHYHSLIYLIGYKYLAAANNFYFFLVDLVASCYVKCKIKFKIFDLFIYKIQLHPLLCLIHLMELGPVRTFHFCQWDSLKFEFLTCSLWDNLTVPHLDLYAAKLFVKGFIYLFSFKIVYFKFYAQIVFSWLISFISYKVNTHACYINFLFNMFAEQLIIAFIIFYSCNAFNAFHLIYSCLDFISFIIFHSCNCF